jgi:hypothetical protein
MRTYLACTLFLVAVACGSDSNRTTNPDGGSSDGGSPGSGVACGGLAGGKCAVDEFCDYAANTCGVADEGGTCKTRPNLCPLGAPADIAGRAYCGCDGKVYSGQCTMNMNGTDLNANATCDVTPDRFACGFLQCELATEYCVHDPKAASADQAYSCVALPGACGNAATCGCLAQVQCGTSCAGDGGKGLTLTCN